MRAQDNFDVILALLHEMVAGGRPQLSQASQLKELVVPPDSQLLKVALNAATAAGCVPLCLLDLFTSSSLTRPTHAESR